MKASVRHINASNEFQIPEGCHIIELSNSDDDPMLSIARARVEPGITTRWHSLLDTSERYVILEGCGAITLGNLPVRQVTVGDTVLIPADCPQRIANIGCGDLVFLAICSPRFRPENYRDLEQE